MTPAFIECDTCASKPGTPTLCRGCQHNRQIIMRSAPDGLINAIYKAEGLYLSPVDAAKVAQVAIEWIRGQL